MGEPVDDDASEFRAELRSWLDDAPRRRRRRRSDGATRRPRTSSSGRRGTACWPTPGWAAPAWPSEHGGRDADLDEQLAYFEEMNARSAPGPDQRDRRVEHRPGDHDATAPTSRRPGSCGRCCGATRSGRRACPSPTPAPTWRRCGARPCSTATTSWSTARRRGTASATSPTGASCTSAPIPTSPKHKGISCLLVDLRTPGHRGSSDPHDHRRRAVQRAVLHRRPHPDAPRCSARSTRVGGSR